MLPPATQNSLLVEWLIPFQSGFPPVLFQALAGRTTCHQCFLCEQIDRNNMGDVELRLYELEMLLK